MVTTQALILFLPVAIYKFLNIIFPPIIFTQFPYRLLVYMIGMGMADEQQANVTTSNAEGAINPATGTFIASVVGCCLMIKAESPLGLSIGSVSILKLSNCNT